MDAHIQYCPKAFAKSHQMRKYRNFQGHCGIASSSRQKLKRVPKYFGNYFFFYGFNWRWRRFRWGWAVSAEEVGLKKKSWWGVGGAFLLEVQYSILKSLISTCVLSYIGSREDWLLDRICES